MNRYKLRKELEKKVYWTIKDYFNLKEEYGDILTNSKDNDGQPRGSGVGDPTSQMAIKVADLGFQIRAIEKGLNRIPPEYQDAVWKKVQYGEEYPKYANKKTYDKWRQRFIFWVAYYLGWCKNEQV